jgi:hypothetical protein
MVFDVVERDEAWWLRIDGAIVGPFLSRVAALVWMRGFSGEDDGRLRRGERARLYTVQSAA